MIDQRADCLREKCRSRTFAAVDFPHFSRVREVGNDREGGTTRARRSSNDDTIRTWTRLSAIAAQRKKWSAQINVPIVENIARYHSASLIKDRHRQEGASLLTTLMHQNFLEEGDLDCVLFKRAALTDKRMMNCIHRVSGARKVQERSGEQTFQDGLSYRRKYIASRFFPFRVIHSPSPDSETWRTVDASPLSLIFFSFLFSQIPILAAIRTKINKNK